MSEPVKTKTITRAEREAILKKLLKLKITTWRYKREASHVRHIGPMAQDFAAAFGVGDNPRVIPIVDAVGAAYASIQALHEQIEQRRVEIKHLKARITKLSAGRKR